MIRCYHRSFHQECLHEENERGVPNDLLLVRDDLVLLQFLLSNGSFKLLGYLYPLYSPIWCCWSLEEARTLKTISKPHSVNVIISKVLAHAQRVLNVRLRL